MEFIKEVGEFKITVIEPYWTETDKGGICLTLPCYTEPSDAHPEGQRLDFHMYFTRQIVTTGNNKGRTCREVSEEQCIKLGMTAPFMPGKYKELDGINATLVTAEDEYKGKKRIVGKWLNTSKKALSVGEVNNLWNQMVNGESTLPKVNNKQPAMAGAAVNNEENDLPY